jgi:hypothetical protein
MHSKQWETVGIKRKRKYPMKNKQEQIFWKAKNEFCTSLFTHEPKSILQILHDFFKKELIPIRKGRTFERIRKKSTVKK